MVVHADPTMDLNEGLGKLRSILHREPSDSAWMELTKELFRWPDTPELELALDYVSEHLENTGWCKFDGEAPDCWRAALSNVIQRLSDLDGSIEQLMFRMRSLILGPFDPRWRVVNSLRFYSQKMGVAGVRVFGMFPMIAELSCVDLGNNQLGDEGVEMLLKSPHLKHLKKLELWSNKIGDEGAKMLSSAAQLKGLAELNLGTNEITAIGVDALQYSEELNSLRTLNLDQNPGFSHATDVQSVGFVPSVSREQSARMSQDLRAMMLSELLLSRLPLRAARLEQCRRLGVEFVTVLYRGERPVAVKGLMESDELRVGRGQDNDWRLLLRGKPLSHVKFEVRKGEQGEGHLSFEDLGTLGGCYVNGRRVRRGQLNSYDSIEFGGGWRVMAICCGREGEVESSK